MAERFQIDAETGQYVPWLAESWQLSSDGKTRRIILQKGVQFHHGYGEFTAKDVVHNHALWCDPNYPGRAVTCGLSPPSLEDTMASSGIG